MTEPVAPDLPLGTSWNESVRDIPDGGIEREHEANTGERAALATALDLLSVSTFRTKYRVRAVGNGRYTLRGRLEATIEQTCVVSLKPMTSAIEQDLDATFWPATEIEAPESGSIDIEDEAEPEPIEDGSLPIGRVIFETFASAVDPFPRAPDAALDWTPPPDAEAKISPFAALAKLKK